MAEFAVLSACPKCARLTVHNTQHCDHLKASRWATVCKWIKCGNTHCRFTYGPANFKGFYPDGRVPQIPSGTD